MDAIAALDTSFGGSDCQLHAKPPDLRHTRSKEAPWIDCGNTPQAVTGALAKKASIKKGDGGSCAVDTGSRVSRTEGTVISGPRDQVSWTELISQQSRRKQGRQALQTYEEMREAGVMPSPYTFVAALKACSSLRDLESAKKIHTEAVESGAELVVHVGNTLVDAYVKCGSLVDARQVFDKMPHRNVVSWTTMILGYAQMKESEEALQMYARMQEESVLPNDRTFVSALKACSSLLAFEEVNAADGIRVKRRCLEHCKRIHRDIVESKVVVGAHLGTMLVDVYAKCGSLVEARSVLEKILHRDVVCWNAMILGYARMGEGEEALQLYARMQREGVVPNARTFVGALKACSCQGELEGSKEAVKQMHLTQVRTIHSHAVNNGAESDIFVGNMLVDVYARCGSLEDARSVFERMPNRDVVSWNAMILGYAQMEYGEYALLLYRRMQQEGFIADDLTFLSALKACSSLPGLEAVSAVGESRCLVQLKAIHSDILKSGSDSIFVGNTLVDVYAKFGSLVCARNVFNTMPHRDVVSWSAMILGYAQMDEGEEALQLFIQMQQEGVVPNGRTFVGALKACSSLAILADGKANIKALKDQCIEQVRAIHLLIVKHECELNLFVGNMLVDAYAKCGRLVQAKHVFEKIPHRDVVSWNALISGYAQMGNGEEALQLYARMQQEGMVPNERTFVGALKACSSLVALETENGVTGKMVKQQCLEQVRAVHFDIVQGGCESDMFVGTMLVDVYARCGSLPDARRVFDKVPHHDVVSWNALIWGYAQTEESDIALSLYARMQQEGVKPDDGTYVGALKACGHVAGLEKGKEIHSQISSEAGVGTHGLLVPTSLIDMYGKCGSMDNAQQVFDALPSRDLVTWSALISGYSQHGDSELVFDLYQKMRQESIEPDGVTFLSILKMCSHVGLVEKGKKFFDVMCCEYGITPTTDHYVCMIDILGRSGQLDKAAAIARTLEPNGVVWKTVLGACRKWSNVELGMQAFDYAVRLDKKDSAAYVLMSNIFAAANMPEDAKRIRIMRKNTGAWKKPGQSWWTDLSGVVHTFLAGDRDHPELQDIYAKVKDTLIRIKQAGYVPHLESVLRDIPDDEKEDALCGHSEKLAIACALLKTPAGTTIRVVKNLRVCEDCHRATAFISKVEGRTIICRDASRFHVYRDGKCSCGGYW